MTIGTRILRKSDLAAFLNNDEQRTPPLVIKTGERVVSRRFLCALDNVQQSVGRTGTSYHP